MVKTIVKQFKQYKKPAILTMLFAALEVIVEVIIPLLMAAIIDKGIQQKNTDEVWKYGLWMLLMAALGLLFGYLAGRYAAHASTGLSSNLRDGMFRNIQTFSFSNIDHYSTSGLVTRMTTDVTNVQNAAQMILRLFIRSIFSLVSAFAMAFMISARLSMVFVVAIVFLIIVLGTVIFRAMPVFNEVFHRYDNLNASVQENIQGIRVVKSFVREEYEKTKFEKAVTNVYRMFVKAESILAFNNPAMMMAVYGCIIGLSWLGATMISAGTLSTGQLTSLFSYVMNILMSLMMLSFVFVMTAMSIASMRRIAQVLNEQADLVSPKDARTEVKDGSIIFDHVSFSYQKESKERVLSDISLQIHSGETIGIFGGTGSSKTSLVNLICRLYDVSEGSVQVGGVDVREYDLTTLRDQVAVVLQKNELFSGTILDNLRWGREDATEEECRHACELACADEFIERFPDRYETWIEQGGSNVSGGQKQRLCIARALLKKPKILILDDSTSAVDTATDAKIRQAFRTEIPDTTKLIIAQRVASIHDADRIIVMDNGTVNGMGSHDELMQTNEIYREVYESQTKGGGDFDEKGA